ncbi:glycosyltransferase family 10 domain-containing protein [Algibacter lectus]|uniref:glycosyltransferase family 10 domain-containing protein n=1 Tax=Algibacter lectus TaxID=221126 RepID=UPI0026EE6A3F|nr:glycosyltransferase family 10 [Algibacter lectus]MDO7135399.1 glycosyltransferase family 10 [Algibacter lectus]
MLVKICRYYPYPDIKRQTPNQSFKWKDITFTEEDVDACDFLVILDYPKYDFKVKVNPNNILHLCLEPANEMSKYRQYANKQVSVIYNQIKNAGKFVVAQPALPWHLDQDYDYFKKLKPESLNKEDKIVWVTSNQRATIQHNKRMDFLDSISDVSFIELYGRGIKEVDSKWDVMKTAKYAIAYENFRNDYYWTEKIADCFLSYTVPLYFGCQRIEDYFPKDAIIQIDPRDKHIKQFLKEIVNSSNYNDKLEALNDARDLVLDNYQLFPFLYNQIQSELSKNGIDRRDNKEEFFFKGGNAYYDNYPISIDIERFIRKVKNRFNNK